VVVEVVAAAAAVVVASLAASFLLAELVHSFNCGVDGDGPLTRFQDD
jgi:hypothetical protein